MTGLTFILGSTTEAQSVMERVRLSQPAEMYWRMDARPAMGFCTCARAPGGQASRSRRNISGKESLLLFMVVGSQHHTADGQVCSVECEKCRISVANRTYLAIEARRELGVSTVNSPTCSRLTAPRRWAA